MKNSSLDLIKEALKIAEPTILAILKKDDSIWGPKWIKGYILLQGLDGRISFEFGRIIKKHWIENGWGDPSDFSTRAEKLLCIVRKEKKSTSKIPPWNYKSVDDIDLGVSTGVYRDSIAIAIAGGAKSPAGEAICEIIISTFKMLCYLE